MGFSAPVTTPIPVPQPEVISLIPTPGSLSPTRIFLSFLILLVFLLVALFSPKSKTTVKKVKGARTVVLVGPLAAGKTSLWAKLLYGRAPQTFTSMKENEAIVKARWPEPSPDGSSKLEKQEKLADDDAEEEPATPLSRPLHLVDTPGHPRLRTRSLAQFLPTADGVVFAIDAVSGLNGKNVRDAGEHLHILLSLLSLLSQSTSRPSAPLLILLAKSDLLTTASSTSSGSTPTKPKSLSQALDRAKQSLAREMERRRLAATPSTVSAGARLEGLEAIPASGNGPTTTASAFKGLLAAFGFGGSETVSTQVESGGVGLPSDESEVLATGEAFAFEGAFAWEKLDVEVKWGVASTKGGEGGVHTVWEWIEEL